MIRVMSFNIRYGLAADGDNHWQHRKGLTLARIRAFDPDLLGLQECRDDAQADFVREGLLDYHCIGVHRGGPGDTALEMAPLLFRRSTFELLETGCFWLSETPETPGSMSWGSAYPRTVTWARLTSLATGAVLTYVNTHFDYEPAAIDGNACCLRHWLDQNHRGTPLILTGDFNADKESYAYRLLAGEGMLRDAHRQVCLCDHDDTTFHAFGHPEERAPIDWILVSGQFRVLAAGIDRWHQGTLYPSDHYPVTATLDWEGHKQPAL
jgi:endonuclease/exonuclease/phosphatase family metal-dependent hydrolase